MKIRSITTLASIFCVCYSSNFLNAQNAHDLREPTPLRPAMMVAAKPVPSYQTEVRFLSFPINKDKSLPDELRLVLQQLKPEQVKVIGGESVKAEQDTMSAPIPDSQSTSLCLSLEPEQIQLLLDAVKASVKANIMTAPKLITEAGQTGEISDGVVRTFVTGVKELKRPGVINVVGYEPIIKQFFEGTYATVCVEDCGENQIRLSSKVTFSKIKNVLDVPIGAQSENKQLRIQLPEVDVDVNEVSETITKGQSLVLTLGNLMDEAKIKPSTGVAIADKLLGRNVLETQKNTLVLVLTVKEVERVESE